MSSASGSGPSPSGPSDDPPSDPPFRCPICGKKFKRLRIMKAHFTQSHRELSNAWASSRRCPLCGKSFTNARGLLRHYFWRALAGFEDHAIAYYLVTSSHRTGLSKEVARRAMDALRAKR